MPDAPSPQDYLVILDNALQGVPDDHLPAELRALKAGGVSNLNFCTSWPMIKPMVQLLGAAIPGLFPGYGAIIAASLGGLLAIGQSIYDTQCAVTPPTP